MIEIFHYASILLNSSKQQLKCDTLYKTQHFQLKSDIGMAWPEYNIMLLKTNC